jgi:hypothetical protein
MSSGARQASPSSTSSGCNGSWRTILTDPAATACSQTTRLPGFRNHKYTLSPLVTIEYRETNHACGPADFPVSTSETPTPTADPEVCHANCLDVVERVRRYLMRVAPAVTGQHGDLHTFRVCCRVVRGFDLSDDDALLALREWNTRCQPPWSERDLLAKIAGARRYGREAIAAHR